MVIITEHNNNALWTSHIIGSFSNPPRYRHTEFAVTSAVVGRCSNKIKREIILEAISDRKVCDLVICDDQNFNQTMKDLRQQIFRMTGVNLTEIC